MDGLKRVRNRHDDALARVDWQQLEHLLADHYRTEGYEVDHVGTGGRGSRFDGGVDLVLRRGSEHVLVQVKHWNARQVPHNAVHELLGLKLTHGATDVVLVSSGEFTARAIEVAGPHVRLIDGLALRAMLGEEVLSRLPAPAPVPGVLPADSAAPDDASKPDATDLSHLAFKPRHRPRVSRGRALLWTVSAALLVLFVVIVRALLAQTAWSAGSSATAPARSSTRVDQVTQSTPDLGGSDQRDTPPTAPDSRPSLEPPMTDAELREWTRRNAESMRVIEASTPEM